MTGFAPNLSIAAQRTRVQALPPERIAELKSRFIESAPESMQKFYRNRIDAARLPTIFIVYAAKEIQEGR